MRKQIENVGELLLQTLPKIPQGVLIVFASRNLMQHFLKYWNSSTAEKGNGYYFNQFKKHKDVFVEPFNDQEAKLTLAEYEKACNKEKKGGLFLISARGRLIEGIDFSDK